MGAAGDDSLARQHGRHVCKAMDQIPLADGILKPNRNSAVLFSLEARSLALFRDPALGGGSCEGNSSQIRRHAVRANGLSDSFPGLAFEVRSRFHIRPSAKRRFNTGNAEDWFRILSAEAQLPNLPQCRRQTSLECFAMVTPKRAKHADVRITSGAEVANHLIVLSAQLNIHGTVNPARVTIGQQRQHHRGPENCVVDPASRAFGGPRAGLFHGFQNQLNKRLLSDITAQVIGQKALVPD